MTKLALLKADALFFDKIYADLMMLLKSNKLGKKLLDMNKHYLELLHYLEEISKHPRLILDPSHHVFPSEPKLYNNSQTNHRNNIKYKPVRIAIYTEHDFDQQVLDLVQSAAIVMANKTHLYKADQLPGGKLWEPSESEKEVLCDIDPTNDVAESVLGLNDWLQKTTANLSQRSVTNMVEVMKNGTMPWFARQAKEFKNNIFKLARARVNEIKKCDDARAEVHRMGRKRAREKLEEKAVKKMKQTEDELGRLATVKKAMTIEEVEEGLLKVQGSTKKKTEKAELKYLRDQIYIHTQKKP